MASELQVTTIRGVPTGANANQIVVPTGQTLSAPGHVIGYSHITWSNNVGTYSYNVSSFTDVQGTDLTYTPKKSNSKILVQWQIMGRALAPSGQDLKYNIRTLLDGGSAQEFEILGDNLGKLGDLVWVPQHLTITREFTSTGAAMAFKAQASRGSANGNYFQLPHYGNSLHHNTVTIMEIAQ